MSEVRAKAWATRRAKYGVQGHNGAYTRCGFDPIGRKALALIMLLHDEAVLSEGQCCKALDLDRVTFRIMRDGHAAAREQSERSSPPAPAELGPRETCDCGPECRDLGAQGGCRYFPWETSE